MPLGKVPGVFDDRTVLDLVDEQQTDGIDNAKRLLAVMNALLYSAENGLTVVG